MRICVRCVMDSSDPLIAFDDQGVCSHCRAFEKDILPHWSPGSPQAHEQLARLVDTIKCTQKDREYDAIIGISGGVDSSYLAYWAAREAGLRLLAVHVDGGWNSDLAVQNIEKTVRHLGIELYTHVVDWEAMRDVQLAFFKAGVANQDTPQDHAFFSVLYGFAVKNNIKYVLNGTNYATESTLPVAWGHDPMDADQVRDICRRFGAPAFDRFPLVSFFQYRYYYPFVKKLKVVRPLNYLNYSKAFAIELLERELGWKYYGGKHFESRFTKFFQGYWLFEKFGYDKRKAHLSSMILAGEITRDQALEALTVPPYDSETVEADLQYVAKKLGISAGDFKSLMAEPNASFRDFANSRAKLQVSYYANEIFFRVLGAARHPKDALRRIWQALAIYRDSAV